VKAFRIFEKPSRTSRTTELQGPGERSLYVRLRGHSFAEKQQDRKGLTDYDRRESKYRKEDGNRCHHIATHDGTHHNHCVCTEENCTC
jgi:hypothetical protein